MSPSREDLERLLGEDASPGRAGDCAQPPRRRERLAEVRERLDRAHDLLRERTQPHKEDT